MQLGDFLEQAESGTPAPVFPVRFKVIGTSRSDGSKTNIEAHAALTHVSEKERTQAIREARKYLQQQDSAVPPDDNDIELETRYQVLCASLRDADNPIKPFASSTTVLRSALTRPVVDQLWMEYVAFMDREFPAWPSEEDFKKLVEEAKSFSLADLLGQGHYLLIQRALPGLAALFGK